MGQRIIKLWHQAQDPVGPDIITPEILQKFTLTLGASTKSKSEVLLHLRGRFGLKEGYSAGYVRFKVAVAPCQHVQLMNEEEVAKAGDPGGDWYSTDTPCALCNESWLKVTNWKRIQQSERDAGLVASADAWNYHIKPVEEAQAVAMGEVQQYNAHQISRYGATPLELGPCMLMNRRAYENRGAFIFEVSRFKDYWATHEAASPEETELFRVELASWLETQLVERTSARFWGNMELLSGERRGSRKKVPAENAVEVSGRYGLAFSPAWMLKLAPYSLDIALKEALLQLYPMRWEEAPGALNWWKLHHVGLTRMLAALRIAKKWTSRSEEELDVDRMSTDEVLQGVLAGSSDFRSSMLESPSWPIWSWRTPMIA